MLFPPWAGTENAVQAPAPAPRSLLGVLLGGRRFAETPPGLQLVSQAPVSCSRAEPAGARAGASGRLAFQRAPLCQTWTRTPAGSLQAGGYKTRRLGHLERTLGEVQAQASVALESRAGPAWLVLAPRDEPRGPPASPSLPRASSFPPSGGHSGPRVLLHLHIFGAHGEVGCPGGSSGKEPACQCRRPKNLGFSPWVRKIPWRRAWQPTPVFLPGGSQGQRSLEGYSPWVAKSRTRLKQLSAHEEGWTDGWTGDQAGGS